MVASRLPIIDVSSPDATAVGRQIDDACRDLGFFLISGHGVSEDAIDRTYAAGLAFFDLPLGEKSAVARPAPDVSRGYNRVGDQSHAATFGEAPTVDLQESFGLGPSEARPQPKTPEEAAAFAPNLWPSRPDDLRPALEAYYRAMERLALRLMELFAEALGVPREFFNRHFDRHASILRLVHYPAQATPPLPGQLRAGPHTDFGTLTILRVDAAAGGLQVRDHGGDWAAVEARPGCLVVNIGDLMQRWTNDRWRSSIHRVVNPPRGVAANSRRLSLVFFHEPDPDTVVRPLSSGGRPPSYPDTVAAAYRQSRVRTLRGVPTKS
ncbi:MAG TPA: 2-oxoglutarate and iron-dependent oxygenase domain-containing protein [Alphaproteobacteria bacterium]|nr:2-oxoglutarate and iron-dependent oxygenase domain-containing protein [Alphaproteobacteria bacterium]